MVDSERNVFVLGLHHLPGEYSSEFRDPSLSVRILDPVKKLVSTGPMVVDAAAATEGGAAGGASEAAGSSYSFECVLPASWEHFLIHERPRKVPRSRAGELLGRLSVSAGQ